MILGISQVLMIVLVVPLFSIQDQEYCVLVEAFPVYSAVIFTAQSESREHSQLKNWGQ